MILVSVLLPVMFGVFLTLLLIELPQRKASLLYIVSFGSLIGLCSFGMLYVFVAMFAPQLHFIRTYVEIGLVALVIYYAYQNGSFARAFSILKVKYAIHWVDVVVCIYFLSIFIFYILDSVHSLPHGEWDAWGMWSAKTRALVFTGGDAKILVDRPYGHPDYPWLLSAINARFLEVLPSFSQVGFITTMRILFFSLIGLTMSSLTILRDRFTGYLAAGFMASIPILHLQFLIQYSDGFLGVSLLAGVSLFLLIEKVKLTKSYFLVGIAVGSLLFTKNEGMVLTIGFAVGYLIYSFFYFSRSDFQKATISIMLALFVFFVVLISFKIFFVTTNNNIMDSVGTSTLAKLIDVARYKTILNGIWLLITNYDYWAKFLLLLIMLPFIFGLDDGFKKPTIFILPIILTVSAGYYMIYVITPKELVWHLYASTDRTFIHVLPILIFLIFLSINRVGKFFEKAV